MDSEISELARLAKGDQRALGEVYDRHVRTVYRYLYYMLRDRADTEDAVQEVFIVAWTKRKSIRIIDHSLLPWLLVTAKNVGRNRLRGRAKDARYLVSSHDQVDLASPSSVVRDVEDRLLQQAISIAVRKLSPSDQALYRLCIEQDLSYGEAASTLQLSHGAVRNRLSRLRRTLRSKLVNQTGEGQ